MEQSLDAAMQPLIKRWGKCQVKEMRRWGSWGGDFSLEAMARKAGLPPELYAGLYATESRAPHALDITSHIQVNADGSLSARLPELAERHLIPSTMTVLFALEMGTEAFKISGFKEDIEALVKRVEQ